MTHDAPALLLDLLAADAQASDFGCGLDPRLREMLMDRMASHPGITRLEVRVRHDGPMPQGGAGLVPGAGWHRGSAA